MFEALSIHKSIDPTVFLELLIGLSPVGTTPPETDYQARILDAAGSFNADRTPTTEDIYGFGWEVDHA